MNTKSVAKRLRKYVEHALSHGQFSNRRRMVPLADDCLSLPSKSQLSQGGMPLMSIARGSATRKLALRVYLYGQKSRMIGDEDRLTCSEHELLALLKRLDWVALCAKSTSIWDRPPQVFSAAIGGGAAGGGWLPLSGDHGFMPYEPPPKKPRRKALKMGVSGMFQYDPDIGF